jgi:hypothetical protein
VVVSNGAVCVAEATSSTVNAKAIRIGNYGVVILQGTAISADVDIGSSAGLYELASGTSPNYPFVEAGSGSGGFSLSRVLN